MLGLGFQKPISDEEREKNNQNRHGFVLATLVVLGIFIYLFTEVYQPLGLASPKSFANGLGFNLKHVFDSDDNVDCEIYITETKLFSNDQERLILFLGSTITFLLAYYLPFKLKRLALTLSFLAIVIVLYGFRPIAGLLGSHIIVYLILHPINLNKKLLAWLPGGFIYLTYSDPNSPTLAILFNLIIFGYTSFFCYWFILRNLLDKERFSQIAGTIAIQSAGIITLLGSSVEGLGGNQWKLPLGILLFFFHWRRLFIYHMDFKSGRIPKNLTLLEYLSIFFAPGQIANWSWGSTIGQGYSYTNDRFYNKDKNQLVLDGIKLLGWSIFYLSIGDWIKYNLVHFVRHEMGVPVFWRLRELGCHFVDGGNASVLTIWFSCLFDQIKWFLLMTGVLHFKVGVWKICGYDIEPNMNKPWLATNLANLWGRITLHYRDFLIRCFYYPVFFRFFKKNLYLRLFAAIMASAGFGNLFWGNIIRRWIGRGLEWKYAVGLLKTWPHFFTLGIGIWISAVWQLVKKDKTRKPWTFDRKFPLDLIAMYVTLQYYSLTHVFFYTCSRGSVWDYWRLFFAGFGIHLDP